MSWRPRWLEPLVIRGLSPITEALIRARVHPNAITTLGFLVAIGAAWAFYQGNLRIAGALVLLGGIFDIFDGRVARGTGLASTFGSFYDSTLDRISEIVVFVGILAFFLADGATPRDVAMAYTIALALGGSLMVSYTRARAEALGLDCRVGFMQRAERIFLLGAATLLFGTRWDALALRIVLVAMAIFTNITAFQRIVWVYLRTRESPPAPPVDSRPVSTPVTSDAP